MTRFGVVKMDFNFDFDSVTQVFNKVKNAVMNYTEYEVKVRDATNNDPWGASSTLMNEISSATFHFHHFNEIMTTIYKRLEESSNTEWRKVYKSLQLIEFLLKNGSDSVIDSVKTHARDISQLESFHYIDDKGKDQGLNVRVRAKEILELVHDNSKLQQDRIKAKENKSKYTGVSSSGVSFSGNSFASKNNNFSFHNTKSDNTGGFDEFEKYKVQSDQPKISQKSVKREKSPPPPVQEVNLLDFDETPSFQNNSSKSNINPTLITTSVLNSDGDDWGEFTVASASPLEKLEFTVASASPLEKTQVSPIQANNDFGNFADFKNLQITQPIKSTQVVPVKTEIKKDPYSNLVNLDSLGSFTAKGNGPSLADLSRKKN